ncbi:MAG: DNA replication/repair protein RecF [Proteobacteria bacterium]|nr:DNA replication/repair protein RecF [Pseudomonadota bacterium]
MAHITSLSLTNFRSYESTGLDGLHAGPVVLYGPNGAGKTNILEALSLLTPGRGLRGAKVGEIQRCYLPPQPNPLYHGEREARTLSERGEGIQPWAVSAIAETPYGETKLGTGRDPATDKRVIRINGEAAKAQSILAEYLSVVWLTPQMDRLFLDAAGTRRRFLDRLVFSFDPGHAGRVTRYENAMSQRSKILKEQPYPDPAWLDALEATMAETGVAIAAARLDFAGRLQAACDRADDTHFPRARIRISGSIDELLTRAPALEVEDLFKYQLKQTRAQDAQTGGAATGPHKSDLRAQYAAKDMPADQCSTGEQKALLIGIVLAHARLIAAERGAPPVLLLDEVAAHLDESRRAGLYNILLAMKVQVWLTGTDRGLFTALHGNAMRFEINGGIARVTAQGKAA